METSSFKGQSHFDLTTSTTTTATTPRSGGSVVATGVMKRDKQENDNFAINNHSSGSTMGIKCVRIENCIGPLNLVKTEAGVGAKKEVEVFMDSQEVCSSSSPLPAADLNDRCRVFENLARIATISMQSIDLEGSGGGGDGCGGFSVNGTVSRLSLDSAAGSAAVSSSIINHGAGNSSKTNHGASKNDGNSSLPVFLVTEAHGNDVCNVTNNQNMAVAGVDSSMSLPGPSGQINRNVDDNAGSWFSGSSVAGVVEAGSSTSAASHCDRKIIPGTGIHYPEDTFVKTNIKWVSGGSGSGGVHDDDAASRYAGSFSAGDERPRRLLRAEGGIGPWRAGLSAIGEE